MSKVMLFPIRKLSSFSVLQSLIFTILWIYLVLINTNCLPDDESTTIKPNKTTKKEKQDGPYRFLHLENNTLHLAGILGLRGPSNLASGGIKKEIETIFTNMKNLLEGYDGTSLERVRWIKFLLLNLNDSSIIDEMFYKHFKAPYPEKSIVEVEDRLMFNANVEVELKACINYTKKIDIGD